MNLDELRPVAVACDFDRRNSTIRRRLVALVAALATVMSTLVLTSPAGADASSWTAQSAAEQNSWYSVTYGNGTFVALAADGANRVMTSPDGVNWTGHQAAEANSWWSLAYGNGLFVAVASDGAHRVMTSPDGVTWTARDAAEENPWGSVTYGNGLFVAVAGDGANRVMTSPDGVNWTAQSAAEQNSWFSVTYGNGLFVAVAAYGANRVMTSPDGVNWTAQTAAAANFWGSVTYGNGLYLATSFDGTNRVMTSPDGVNWSAHQAAEANSWWVVTYGNGLFVSVSMDGTNRVMMSTDGATWTAETAAEANEWWGVAYGNGKFVAVAADGANRVMTRCWTASTPDAPTSLVATPGDGSASIAFTPGANCGPAITKYQVKVGAGAWTDVVGTTSPITVTGLTNYATAKIKLRAVNSVGAGPASAVVPVRPRVVGSPLTSVKVQSRSRIQAAFAALTPVGGSVSHYWVYAYAKGTNTVAGSCRSTVAARSCVVTGLSADTEYDVAVRGFFTLTGSPTVLPTTDSARQTVRTKR